MRVSPSFSSLHLSHTLPQTTCKSLIEIFALSSGTGIARAVGDEDDYTSAKTKGHSADSMLGSRESKRRMGYETKS